MGTKIRWVHRNTDGFTQVTTCRPLCALLLHTIFKLLRNLIQSIWSNLSNYATKRLEYDEWKKIQRKINKYAAFHWSISLGKLDITINSMNARMTSMEALRALQCDLTVHIPAQSHLTIVCPHLALFQALQQVCIVQERGEGSPLDHWHQSTNNLRVEEFRMNNLRSLPLIDGSWVTYFTGSDLRDKQRMQEEQL